MSGMRIEKDFKFASDQLHNISRWWLLPFLGFHFHLPAVRYYSSSFVVFVASDYAIRGKDGLFLLGV